MSLLSIIKKTPEVRSIFGERELKIIEKQLFGIKLKPSEKTRLSRDIKRKFRAIKALAEFSDESNLKHGKIIKRLIEDSKERILESEYYKKINKIIVFGSTVENKRNFSSDVDIAVEFDYITNKEATEFLIKTKIGLSKDIDLEVYNILPEKIKKEIDEKGKTIYERKN